MGLTALQHVGSSWIRDWICVSCTGRWIPYHWATREAQEFKFLFVAIVAKSHQSCPTLCDPIGGSPPGSAIPGILQARILEWVAISFSNAWKWKVKVKSLSHVQLLATPWTAAYQAPLSMRFSRQEYWSGGPLPSPTEPPGKPLNWHNLKKNKKIKWTLSVYLQPLSWQANEHNLKSGEAYSVLWDSEGIFSIFILI